MISEMARDITDVMITVWGTFFWPGVYCSCRWWPGVYCRRVWRLTGDGSGKPRVKCPENADGQAKDFVFNGWNILPSDSPIPSHESGLRLAPAPP